MVDGEIKLTTFPPRIFIHLRQFSWIVFAIQRYDSWHFLQFPWQWQLNQAVHSGGHRYCCSSEKSCRACFCFLFPHTSPFQLLDKQAVVTGVVPSSPRSLPLIFIAHRVQQSHCYCSCFFIECC